MLEIKTSLDWQNVEREIQKLGNTLTMFKHDINTILKTVREEVTILSKLEVEHRSTRSRQVEQQCRAQAARINETLKLFQKYHLMALLTQ